MTDQVGPPARVVRVVPDVAGITKAFDYLVPPDLDDRVEVGTLVRVVLNGRRVGGWVVADGVQPPAGVALRPLAHVTGMGPSAEVVALAGWAAWRWAGRPRHLLRSASPDGAVKGLPPTAPVSNAVATVDDGAALEALARERTVFRLPPAADLLPLVAAAARLGTTLVVAPDHAAAASLGGRLRRAGVPLSLIHI